MLTISSVPNQSGSFLISSFRTPSISVCKFKKAQYGFIKVLGTSLGNSVKCASMGRNYSPRFVRKDKFEQEPFWLTMMKDVVWSLRSLGVFLVEQPSQLKHIEWPTFQSTLKTATLTLVLVAVLIVALSSVDSLLCYILALLLRKAA